MGPNRGFERDRLSAELGESGFHTSQFWSETSNFNMRLISQMRSEGAIHANSLL